MFDKQGNLIESAVNECGLGGVVQKQKVLQSDDEGSSDVNALAAGGGSLGDKIDLDVPYLFDGDGNGVCNAVPRAKINGEVVDLGARLK